MSKKMTHESTLDESYLKLIRVDEAAAQERLARARARIHPRPQEKPPRGKMWCPYCGEWHEFKSRPMKGSVSYLGCEKCGISLDDYDVKIQNHLWKK